MRPFTSPRFRHRRVSRPLPRRTRFPTRQWREFLRRSRSPNRRISTLEFTAQIPLRRASRPQRLRLQFLKRRSPRTSRFTTAPFRDCSTVLPSQENRRQPQRRRTILTPVLATSPKARAPHQSAPVDVTTSGAIPILETRRQRGGAPPHRSRKRSSTAWCITIRTSTRTCIARLTSSPRDRPTHTKARARRCSVSLVRDLQKKSFSSAAPQKQSTSLPRATAGSSSARAMRSFCRRSSTIPTSCRGNSWRSGSPPSSAWFR